MNPSSYAHLVDQYDREGFAIARNVIDPDLAAETANHVLWLLEKHPGTRPEQLHHDILKDDPFIWRLTGDNRILDLVSAFIGDDIALFAAHYVAKPPKTGQKVLWHQDGSYWPLDPMEVMTIWLAADDSTVQNGCMRVIPGTHHQNIVPETELVKTSGKDDVLGSGLDPKTLDESTAVDIELKAGDVSIHNPNIVHGSNPNTSDSWRRGLTLRYIPTTTRVLRDGHGPLLLRGSTKTDFDNGYEPRPVYVPGVHMPFAGAEKWND